jgi:hypothetical protein
MTDTPRPLPSAFTAAELAITTPQELARLLGDAVARSPLTLAEISRQSRIQRSQIYLLTNPERQTLPRDSRQLAALMTTCGMPREQAETVLKRWHQLKELCENGEEATLAPGRTHAPRFRVTDDTTVRTVTVDLFGYDPIPTGLPDTPTGQPHRLLLSVTDAGHQPPTLQYQVHGTPIPARPGRRRRRHTVVLAAGDANDPQHHSALPWLVAIAATALSATPAVPRKRHR